MILAMGVWLSGCQIIVKIARTMRAMDIENGQAVKAISSITNAAKKTDLAAIRKTVFSTQSVGFAAAAGKNAEQRMYRRSRNLRIHPFAIATLVAYLESRVDCDPETTIKCEKLNTIRC